MKKLIVTFFLLLTNDLFEYIPDNETTTHE